MTQTPGPANEIYLANVNAERAVVGSLLMDPGFAAAQVKRLQPADFSDPIARALIRAYLEHGGTDVIEISTHAALAEGQPTQPYYDYALTQIASVPSAIEIETYVGLVIEAAERRRGLEVISHAGAGLWQGKNWNEVSLWLAGHLHEQRTAAEDRPVRDVIDGVYTQVVDWHEHPIAEGEVRYLTTGFRDLNTLTGGLRPALYLCGARPSVGKTALWAQIAVKAAQALAASARAKLASLPPCGSEASVLYFTNEMTDQQLVTRLICSLAGVDLGTMECGRLTAPQLQRTFDGMDALQRLPLRFIYARSLGAILSRCYQGARPALIIIDYLNNLSGGRGENRNQQFGQIAKALLDMANDLQTPTVLLCQLNRDLAKRGPDALPEMEDLRDSGELDQAADVILLLHRTKAAPEALHVLKRKDRLGGGQNQGITLTFSALAQVGDAPRIGRERARE